MGKYMENKRKPFADNQGRLAKRNISKQEAEAEAERILSMAKVTDVPEKIYVLGSRK